MADAGELKARATLDNAEFLKAMKDMANQAGAQSQAISDQISNLTGAFGNIADAVGKIGIGAAMGKFAGDCLEAAAATDKLAAGFNAINGPSAETTAIFDQISGLEVKSMFDFEDTLGPAAKNMMMLGVSATQTSETMTALVDAAAGLKEGPEWINAVSGTIATMQSHIVASGKDMKALQAQGIDAWTALAREIGTSVPEAMEQVKQGVVSAETVTKAVTKEMGERFAGAGERSMDSWKGAMHILDETVEDAMVGIGHTIKGVLDDLKPVLTAASDAVAAFAEWWKDLPGPIQEALVIIPAVIAAVVGVSGAVAAFSAGLALLEFNPVILGITALVAALALIGKWAYDNWPAIKAVFAEAGAFLADLFSPLIALWQGEWDAIKAVLSPVWDWVAGIISKLQTVMSDFLGWIGGMFSKLPGGSELQKIGQIWDTEQKKMTEAKAAIDAKKQSDAEAAAQSAKTKQASEAATAAELAAANAAKAAGAERKKAAAEAEKAAKEREAYQKKLETADEKLADADKKLQASYTKAMSDMRQESNKTVTVVVDNFARWGEAAPITVFLRTQEALKALGVTSTAMYTKAISDAEAHAAAVKKGMETGVASADDYRAALAVVAQKEKDLKEYTEKELTDAYKQLGVTSSASFTQTATDAKTAYDKIAASGTATEADLKQAWGNVLKAQQAIIDHADKEVTDAFHRLGVNTTAEFQNMAREADTAYNTIVSESGIDSMAAKTAWVTKTEETYANILAQGGKLTEDQKSELAKRKQDIENHLTDTQSMWATAYGGVKTAVSGAIDSLIEKLVTGQGSFKEIMTGMWQDIASTALHTFIDPVKTAIADFIATTIADLLSGKGLGGVLDSLKEIGETAKTVFGSGAKAAGGDVAGDVAGGVKDTAGSSGSVAAGVSGGLTGWITAISSVVTAISSVIQNFQLAKMETTLNAIEESTRRTLLYTGDRADGGILGILFRIYEEISWGANTKANERMRDLFFDWTGIITPVCQAIQYQLEGLAPYIVDTKVILEDIRTIATNMQKAIVSNADQERKITVNVDASGLTTGEVARELGDRIARNLSRQLVPTS